MGDLRLQFWILDWDASRFWKFLIGSASILHTEASKMLALQIDIFANRDVPKNNDKD